MSEVTEASKEAPVVVLLVKDAIEGSRALETVMHRVRACARRRRVCVRAETGRVCVLGRL